MRGEHKGGLRACNDAVVFTGARVFLVQVVVRLILVPDMYRRCFVPLVLSLSFLLLSLL